MIQMEQIANLSKGCWLYYIYGVKSLGSQICSNKTDHKAAVTGKRVITWHTWFQSEKTTGPYKRSPLYACHGVTK